MKEIPGLVRKSQMNKHDPEWLQASEVDERVQQRRYGTTQAAEMAGISTGLLYSAEQDGRLPEPEFRSDTAKKTRAGYTINHINHMQKVFNTAPR
jgi:chromosome partitioning protein